MIDRKLTPAAILNAPRGEGLKRAQLSSAVAARTDRPSSADKWSVIRSVRLRLTSQD